MILSYLFVQLTFLQNLSSYRMQSKNSSHVIIGEICVYFYDLSHLVILQGLRNSVFKNLLEKFLHQFSRIAKQQSTLLAIVRETVTEKTREGVQWFFVLQDNAHAYKLHVFMQTVCNFGNYTKNPLFL